MKLYLDMKCCYAKCPDIEFGQFFFLGGAMYVHYVHI